jgi:hypothetical protein
MLQVFPASTQTFLIAFYRSAAVTHAAPANRVAHTQGHCKLTDAKRKKRPYDPKRDYTHSKNKEPNDQPNPSERTKRHGCTKKPCSGTDDIRYDQETTTSRPSGLAPRR